MLNSITGVVALCYFLWALIETLSTPAFDDGVCIPCLAKNCRNAPA